MAMKICLKPEVARTSVLNTLGNVWDRFEASCHHDCERGVSIRKQGDVCSRCCDCNLCGAEARVLEPRNTASTHVLG